MNSSPFLTYTMAEVVRFAIVLFRVGGIMVFAPLFSSRSIPMQVRAAITLLATLALCPALPLAKVPPAVELGQVLNLAMSEVLFGVVLGLAASFLFAAMQLAGQIISFQLGFSIINVIDPTTEVETTVISFLQYYIGLLFFLIVNGHHWFFTAVSDSFQYLPIGGVRLQGPVVVEMIRLSAQVIVFGVQLAGPVITVTVVTDVVLGIISRAAPQINIMIVGMPFKILAGFACMSISFFFLPRLLETWYTSFYHDLMALLHRMG
jgi:flagellar biosynthesis protein FliR